MNKTSYLSLSKKDRGEVENGQKTYLKQKGNFLYIEKFAPPRNDASQTHSYEEFQFFAAKRDLKGSCNYLNLNFKFKTKK